MFVFIDFMLKGKNLVYKFVFSTKTVKKLYCVICGKYKNLKKSETSSLLKNISFF